MKTKGRRCFPYGACAVYAVGIPIAATTKEKEAMTEVWFRNPHNYVRQLAEVGGTIRVAWDRGMLVKRRIEPVAHAKLYFGAESNFEILAIGKQGTAHLDSEHTLENPKAVYPTWSYGEDMTILEEMVSSPIGLDQEACESDVPVDERPVYGQDHRVILTDLPNSHLVANRPFYRTIRELQEEFPECNMMIHGMYAYRILFGLGMGSCDVDPRTSAANGKVFLPNGKEVAFARTIGMQQWVNLLGMSVIDLKLPANRCIYNIKSALWAGEHFNEDVKFKSHGSAPATLDPNNPVKQLPVVATKGSGTFNAVEGDMITCDTCGLADKCKLYREGAVCSVQGSESSNLAKMFNSRDSSKIIDGLGAVMEASVNRLQRGMESEEEFGELDPEVSKMMNQVFQNGIKLAKLVDPSLTKPLVQINGGVGGGANQLNGLSSKELMATVVREIEAQGIRREDITPQMVESMLVQMSGGRSAPSHQPEPIRSLPQTIEGEVE